MEDLVGCWKSVGCEGGACEALFWVGFSLYFTVFCEPYRTGQTSQANSFSSSYENGTSGNILDLSDLSDKAFRIRREGPP